mmetsp:Transcript_352/g.517  ORF Transcript_352/g.517 Transcript_352/m.517 type:complete len:125 (+) Transcript_352:1152-1526(+)|eukprot:CAMPEP_0185621734 /NCGR_PEP_ID=MMETSP0436-20130131/58406_1 /TAXON_ID=626734 ORGANISM="Favella taraikaensis, Strain Fe Narragansett Bay" /NCGR_SAMPLE_ID=MMETSP0436 /ASSEMBLY_ACC=CAM_ASM_000390 /LENGTH=124 /DNA_ID=CAMNT_0028263257 /DNA_START=564 /DNA_END=938 /DNA_ORIENTATION=-
MKKLQQLKVQQQNDKAKARVEKKESAIVSRLEVIEEEPEGLNSVSAQSEELKIPMRSDTHRRPRMTMLEDAFKVGLSNDFESTFGRIEIPKSDSGGARDQSAESPATLLIAPSHSSDSAKQDEG